MISDQSPRNLFKVYYKVFKVAREKLKTAYLAVRDEERFFTDEMLDILYETELQSHIETDNDLYEFKEENIHKYIYQAMQNIDDILLEEDYKKESK